MSAKRSSELGGLPLAKRVSSMQTGSNSEVPEEEIDMVKFKNKQLSIRNRELRSELNILEARIHRILVEKQKTDQVWGAVGEKWTRLDSELSLLLSKVSENTLSEQQSGSSPALSLLEIIHGSTDESMDVESDDKENEDKEIANVVDKVREELETRSKFTVQVVKRIVEGMVNNQGNLINEDDATKREFKLQAKVNELIKQNNEIKNTLAIKVEMVLENKQLVHDVIKMNNKLVKKVDLLENYNEAKANGSLEKEKSNGVTANEKGSKGAIVGVICSNSNSSADNNDNDIDKNKDNPNTDGLAKDSQYIEDLNCLKDQVNEFRILADNRLNELNTMKEELSIEKTESKKLLVHHKIVSDADIKESIAYKGLQVQMYALSKELQEAKNISESAMQESVMSKQNYAKLIEQFEIVDKEKEDKTSMTIKDLEERAARYRNERNKTKAELDEFKSKKDSSTIQKEMRSLIAHFQIQITHLKDELQRSQEKLKSYEERVDTKDNDKLKEFRETLEKALVENKFDEKAKEAIVKIEHNSVKLVEREEAEKALMAEMETIIEAYDEIQEHNTRLVTKLEQQDDGNMILLTQQMKLKKYQQHAKEERDVLLIKLETMNKKIEAQVQLMRSLDEREKNLFNQNTILEKDIKLRIQELEKQKRLTLDNAQICMQLETALEKVREEYKVASKAFETNVQSSVREAYLRKRVEEERDAMVKKLKQYKNAGASTSDEIMVEEIRGYKELVNCSLCKRRQRNTILTKCFHLFCSECIQERYEHRQRKCPSCMEPFGQNDFRQFYW